MSYIIYNKWSYIFKENNERDKHGKATSCDSLAVTHLLFGDEAFCDWVRGYE